MVMDSYEQKYKEALERAKKLQKTCDSQAVVGWCEYLFPELAESKDERMRKELTQYLIKSKENERAGSIHGNFDEWISWLENQSQEKSIDMGIKEKACQIAWETSKHYDPLLSKESWCEMAALDMANWLKKQGEQNESVTDFRIEAEKPKFKIGDWITNDRYTRYIVGINSKRYQFKNGTVKYCDDVDKKYHLWTIQDAKPGDVLEFGDHGRLVIGIVGYVNETTGKVDVCCLLENKCFKIGNYYNLDTIKPHPATKEQHDLLFSKMEEAGYEWDTEKLELKKIERQGEQENAGWSEDDEEALGIAILALSKPYECDGKYDRERAINWLKSIKQRK